MTHPEERPVSENAPPILVYDRIDANRRKTRLLLTLFALALLPVVLGSAVFIVPSIYAMLASARPAGLASLQVQLDAIQPTHGALELRDLPSETQTQLLWLYGGVNLVSMAIVALALVAATAFLISRYGSRIVLRGAHARPVDPGQERDLVQVVENLCIGAGLLLPRIYVIESTAPNAFATGRSPRDASLVVTRGLLGLLDRRELEGVIAHELSHIGNHDIGLSTRLAAVVGTLGFPLKMLSAPFRFAFRRHWAVGGVVTVLGLIFVLPLLLWWLLGVFFAVVGGPGIPFTFWWWKVYFVCVMMAPLYLVFVAPVVALLIRQAVSRQREFLADADAALLTRDPEGLALALVKIGAVGGERLRVGAGTVHLYFVDPLSKGSWLHALFPSHPSLEKRVELLARMGNGIAPSTLQAARDAGARVQSTKSGLDEVHAPVPGPQSDEPASFTQTTEPAATSDDGFSRSAPVTMPPAADADYALTPLYEQPDGWSRVLALLPESAVVIPIATAGHFIRVTTAEHQAGYVSRSAPLTALKNFQR
jgi:heat shock protein HtpX